MSLNPLDGERISTNLIEELWRVHLATRFPPACSGRDVAGEDLVMLDADVAGCVSTYLHRGGVLDQQRIDILSRCYSKLPEVVAQLSPEERPYFEHVQRMANALLAAVAS